MADDRFGVLDDRARVGWWAFVLILAGSAVFVAHSFVGIFVIGVFGYYATRPICRRLDEVFDSDWIAAAATATLVLLPVVLVTLYASFQLVQQAQRVATEILGQGAVTIAWLPPEQEEALRTAFRNPRQFFEQPRSTLRTVFQTGTRIVSIVANVLLTLTLGVTLSYYLLENDDALADGLEELFGGRETAMYAYAAAVDDDLESIFFGNLQFVVAMAVIATGAYWGTNALAPPGIQVPMLFVLAFLTGIASLIPIVVGKVVYVPLVGYLAFQAVRLDGGHLAFVGGALVAYVLLLDLLPQMVLQPYITSHDLDWIVMLFAYILGPMLFGWYGFFLMPILFVLFFEVVRIVLPELVHGDRLTRTPSLGEANAADRRTAVQSSGAGETNADSGTTETEGSGEDDPATGTG